MREGKTGLGCAMEGLGKQNMDSRILCVTHIVAVDKKTLWRSGCGVHNTKDFEELAGALKVARLVVLTPNVKSIDAIKVINASTLLEPQLKSLGSENNSKLDLCTR